MSTLLRKTILQATFGFSIWWHVTITGCHSLWPMFTKEIVLRSWSVVCCKTRKLGRGIHKLSILSPWEFPKKEGPVMHLWRRKKDTGTLPITWEAECHPYSSPPELEGAGAFWILLEDREEVARAIVVLTMENDFHRQVDCFRGCRKIKPVSTTTWNWERPLLKGQS